MKIDRLLGILTVLLQQDRVTAPQLAERFEVSRRTISRDVDALCQAGIPVVTMPGAGGGIAIAEEFKLDKSLLTYEELSNIIVSLKGLGSVVQGDSAVERTLTKIVPAREDTVVSLRESLVIDLSSEGRGTLKENIAAIQQAVRASRRLAFTYYYDKGESEREVEPYVAAFVWGGWYLYGYCLLREDWRLFKLARMQNVRVLEAGFAPRQVAAEQMRFS